MENITTFLKDYKIHKYKKGEVIFLQEDTCEYVGFVKSGSIKISSIVLNDKEVIYNNVNPGEMFGENLIFSSNKRFRGDVVAVEETELYLLSKKELVSLLMTNEDFLELFMRLESNFIKNLNLKIKLLTFNSLNDRLLYYLDINSGKIKIKSITSLAETLNVSRESLSRCLHNLSKKQIIHMANKVIVKI